MPRDTLQSVLDLPECRETTVARNLLPADRFRPALEQTRALTDRSGEEFSLISFGLRDRKAARTAHAHVPELFAQWPLRATDEAGWLDDRHLGILLPSTSGRGAWTVANRLSADLHSWLALPDRKVYVYPSDPPSAAGCDGDLEGSPGDKEPLAPMEFLFVRRQPMWKRALDMGGAGVGLLILTPVFLAAAMATKLDSAGPVFFAQWRSGQGGRPFRMFKFRSMVVDAESRKRALMALNEQDGPAFKIQRDPRVTTVGRWLRATSIDELPQLWNVLIGDMSLVGPRPLPCDETRACSVWQRGRLDVKPGLTCFWQLQKRSAVSFTDWMRMDAQYIRSLSPWADLKLLFATFPAVFLRRNA
ncbi:MAG: sugar transferase [Thermoguttaceae bacterium]|jgi:lipopolysaccharide/colanic/teichoic acid biosynthesis glycosyltransferase